jgi:hypothetical protein
MDEKTIKKIKNNLYEIDASMKAAGIGDVFSYSKIKEVLIAAELGHNVSANYDGADGIEPDGTLAEYKSTIGSRINATYNGISKQPTWEQQEKYLKEKKIGKYPNHYYARFEGVQIVELWKLRSDDVLKILLPKLKRDWDRKDSIDSKHTDQRPGANVCMTEIKKYGTRVI